MTLSRFIIKCLAKNPGSSFIEPSFNLLASRSSWILFDRAALCRLRFRLSHGSSDDRQKSSPSFYFGIAAVFVALAVNEQLNLLSKLTRLFSFLAWKQDWYGARQLIQVIWILAVLVASMLTLISSRRLSRELLSSKLVILDGVVFLLAVIVIHSISLHYLDRFFDIRLGFLKMYHLFELGGISIVVMGVLNELRCATGIQLVHISASK